MKPSIVFNRLSKCWKQRKCGDVFTESREFGHSGDVAKKLTVKLWGKGVYAKLDQGSANTHYFIRHTGQFIYSKLDFLNSAFGVVNEALDGYESTADMPAFDCHGVNPYFMYYRAIQPSFYITNGMIADGSRKAKRVHAETFLQMPLMLPSIEEQDKIAWFFRKLEDTITIHQRKINSMKRLKKSLLQKMFPQNGECVPEIRFSGFTDSWEQRKVDDITSSYSGGTPQAGNQDYYNGDIPFIRSGEIYQSHTELFITQKGLNNSSAKMVSKGDILYALYGATSGEVSRSKLDGAINQAILAIHPKDDFNADFLVEWFRKEKDNIISRYLQGGQGNLSAQIIKNLDVMIPSSSEQKMIGDFFSNLNNLITLHQRKALQLQKIKQALLQHMFI